MIGDGGLGRERGGEHEADFVLRQHVGGALAHAGFGSAIGSDPEPERRAVVVRGLARVANVELDVVGSVERQKILFNLRGLFQYLRHKFSLVHRCRGDCRRRGRWICGGNSASRTPPADALLRPAPASLRKYSRRPPPKAVRPSRSWRVTAPL